MKKIFINPWFGGMVLTGLPGLFSLFSIDACYGGNCNLNWLFIPAGIVLTLLAVFFLVKTIETSNTGKDV
jgi:hypothetical protein